MRFGGVVALDRVSFSVDAGELVALIGPNGAGKTTLFNVITRVYRPSAGTVLIDGRSVLSIRPHNVIRHGLARTFQNLALFRSMTVLDNVLVGDHTQTRSGWLQASVPLPARPPRRPRPASALSRSSTSSVLRPEPTSR